jgi:hypothetical protein
LTGIESGIRCLLRPTINEVYEQVVPVERMVGYSIEKIDTTIIARKRPIRSRRLPIFTVAPIFRCQLGGYNLRLIGASWDTIYLLDAALCIRGYNAEYERFALRNGGVGMLRRFGLGSYVIGGSPALTQHITGKFIDAASMNTGSIRRCLSVLPLRLFVATARR